MKVILSPNEGITIGFADSDGEIHVGFSETRVYVETGWPDTKGRVGVIYEEKFGQIPKEKGEE